MVVFPNCKINLGLQVIGKREDGYHNLETVFYPLALKDAVEVIEAKEDLSSVLFRHSGIAMNIDEADNLCLKAFHLLKKEFPQLPAIHLHLHKNIPLGAGLGGGSADAAFVLQLLNSKFSLGLTETGLLNYAAALGSDCPFFILNKPCLASGRGEILEEISLDLSPFKILLVYPGIIVNTAWAFTQIIPKENANIKLKELIQHPINTWQKNIVNDFEIPVFNAHPEILKIKLLLYERGALYASLSGSGSSVFGIFPKDTVPITNFPPHYFCRFA